MKLRLTLNMVKLLFFKSKHVYKKFLLILLLLFSFLIYLKYEILQFDYEFVKREYSQLKFKNASKPIVFIGGSPRFEFCLK